MADDVIRLSGMRFFGHHGDLEPERALGSHLSVDVEISTDMRDAARSDSLGDAIDYVDCVERVREVVEDEQHRLLETVAERIAAALLEQPRAQAVRVRVGKRPPLAATIEEFSVEVHRRRE